MSIVAELRKRQRTREDMKKFRAHGRLPRLLRS